MPSLASDLALNYGYGDQEQVRFESAFFRAEVSGAFGAIAKNRLVKLQGIMRADFNPYLKEYEFRVNVRDRNIYKYLLTEFRKKPLT